MNLHGPRDLASTPTGVAGVLLTISDVQGITQLGRTTIYELMRSGSLPYLKIGRSVRIRREALEVWITSHEESLR